MTFHWPLLFVCLLNYLLACQRTFRIYKNDRFWTFSGCGTSPSLFRFCGTLGLSTWACTIPLRQHILFILPFCLEPSFDVPPSVSDRQRQVLGIQSLVLLFSLNLQWYQPLYPFYFTVSEYISLFYHRARSG